MTLFEKKIENKFLLYWKFRRIDRWGELTVQYYIRDGYDFYIVCRTKTWAIQQTADKYKPINVVAIYLFIYFWTRIFFLFIYLKWY